MQILTDKNQNIIFKFSYKEIFKMILNRKLIFPRTFLRNVGEIFFKAELNFLEQDKKNKNK
jgi:hypothetical protein